MLIWTSFMQVNTCMTIQIMVSLIQKRNWLYELLMYYSTSDALRLTPSFPCAPVSALKRTNWCHDPGLHAGLAETFVRLLPISRVHASWLYASRVQSSCSNRIWIVEKFANDHHPSIQVKLEPKQLFVQRFEEIPSKRSWHFMFTRMQ